jgi:hypothetical protein
MSDRDSPERKPLEVIRGDWVSAPDWLDFPDTIRARSPESRSIPCRVRISRADTYKAADARRRQPAYDLWGVLLGKPPPVPHDIPDAAENLTTLFDAHACFRGLKRPIAEDSVGGTWLAYVLKPRFMFAFVPTASPTVMEKRAVPPDLVFVAYVRLDEPSVGNPTKGVLTHWHFVETEGWNHHLPLDFENRYVERLW